ncbi:MAG: hypothetical protein EXR75_15285 [Myxococcales bacterium]|nr:hypothetical protein [Myxococcales bacterium]
MTADDSAIANTGNTAADSAIANTGNTAADSAIANTAAHPDERKALVPPPRRVRNATVGVMFVTAVSSALMAMSLAPEALYSLADREAVELGDLGAAKLDSTWSGRYVRATAELQPSAHVAFKRVGEPGERRLGAVLLADAGPLAGAVPLANAGPRLVDYAVPPSERGARFVPPTLLRGRLERLPELGLRHRGIARAVMPLTGGKVGDAWVLVDGSDPASSRWALGLEAVLLAFFAFNAGGIVLILRRAQRLDEPDLAGESSSG